MNAGLLALSLTALILPAVAWAQQPRDYAKGIVCSGPTPFHCAAFAIGFNKFFEAQRGKWPSDQAMAAAFCERDRSMAVGSAKRRGWPGGPLNETIVVDVVCAPRGAAPMRPAPPPVAAVRPPAPSAPRPVVTERRRPAPPPVAALRTERAPRVLERQEIEFEPEIEGGEERLRRIRPRSSTAARERRERAAARRERVERPSVREAAPALPPPPWPRSSPPPEPKIVVRPPAQAPAAPARAEAGREPPPAEVRPPEPKPAAAVPQPAKPKPADPSISYEHF